jgi:membrane fusion protein (multidrug efflux system)
MRLIRIVLLLIVFAAISGALYSFAQYKNAAVAKLLAARANPVITVTAEPVQQESWQDTVSAVGTLKAINGV